MIGIYKITNPNGKIYIGQSKDLDRRFRQYNNKNCKGQIHLYNSLKKYGVENHKFEIIDICDEEFHLNFKEYHYQKLYKVVETGLNCTYIDPYKGVNICTDEIKAKMSRSHKGKKLSLDHCKAIGLSKTGIIQSDETRLKRSNSLKGRKYSEISIQKMRDYALTRTYSEITRKKMSESQHCSKKVIDISTNIIYNSIKECSRELDLNYKSLYRKVIGFYKENDTTIRLYNE